MPRIALPAPAIAPRLRASSGTYCGGARRAPAEIVRGDEDAGMGEAAHHEHPGQQHDDEIGMAKRQCQRDQRIEQHRQFELIAIAVADLGGADRPVRLAKRDIANLVSPLTNVPRLAPTIHNSSAKVSPT